MAYPSNTLYPGANTFPGGVGSEPTGLLYPSTTVYPSTSLYPGSSGGTGGTGGTLYPSTTVYPSLSLYPGYNAGGVTTHSAVAAFSAVASLVAVGSGTGVTKHVAVASFSAMGSLTSAGNIRGIQSATISLSAMTYLIPNANVRTRVFGSANLSARTTFIMRVTGTVTETESDPSRFQIKWNLLKDRQIEAGLDRGVLFLKDGASVPWNGLTAVDEEGGEGAAEYYIDGRPFLYLPKPKEFKATLKAYMYPDAFSSVLGEIEVTDGMYLDSQIGDSFGLSYRTRVFDNVQGENAGYKIHLIYNATVVPSAKSYSTFEDMINPVEFSWDIQAVPVKVEGYRSTAHITIDTRHMSFDRIGAIEDLIYGTSTVDAVLPDPQDIFDMLSYGDTIVIYDNGNGTWTAEGSYLNIYMIGDEIFQIDNVNAVHHGDGTYTISSTI